jgi:hypothetical protein
VRASRIWTLRFSKYHRPATGRLNTHMLIHEVTAKKPRSPAEQRVAALRSQLDQAREAAKRQRLAARQAQLNQQRAALNNPTAQ